MATVTDQALCLPAGLLICTCKHCVTVFRILLLVRFVIHIIFSGAFTVEPFTKVDSVENAGERRKTMSHLGSFWFS